MILAHIPGNILKGNWKVRVYIDDKATAQQKDALIKVWTGKAGGRLPISRSSLARWSPWSRCR